MAKIPLLIKKLHPDAVIPVYQHEGDAGFDFYCVENAIIPAGQAAIIPTGLAIAIPEGYEIQIRLRSGAALRTPLIIANAPGTIDAGYRGEIGIILRNSGSAPWEVHKGERIAQGVLAPVKKAEFIQTEELPCSGRASGGFGSTGEK